MRLTKCRFFLFFISLSAILIISGGTRAEEVYPTGPAWEANWIWDGGEPSPHNFYLYVRKEFELPADAVSAKIRVTADSRYILYVNGRMVGRGPVKSDRRWLYYDEWNPDKTQLQQGKNVIAALVHHYGEWTFSYMHGRGGFILEADIELKNGKHLKIVTDKTWKVKAGEGWYRGLSRMSVQQGFPEVFDARKEPVGWNDTGFDGMGWKNAVELGRPPLDTWPRLIKRTTPPLTDDYGEAPVSMIGFGDAVPGPRNEGVDFTQFVSGEDNSVAYAATYLYSPSASKAGFVLSSKNACRLYVGGKTLISNYVGTGLEIDKSKKYSDLHAGWTPLIVKCVKNADTWNFTVSVDAPERASFIFSTGKDPEKTGWAVVGPFRKTGKIDSEYKKEYPPQKELDFSKSYEGAGGKPVAWKNALETDKTATRLAYALSEMELKPLSEGRVDEGGLCDIMSYRPCFSRVMKTKPGGAVYFVLDFGREIAGFSKIRLISEAGGETIDVGYSEVLEDKSGMALSPLKTEGGRVNPARSDVNYADRYITRAGSQEWVSINRHAFRYMLIVVRDAVKPVYLGPVALSFSTYDAGDRGRFESSSELLNRIWKVGAYTVQLNMEDSYTDCPWRERGQWWGDARVEALINYYAFGDKGLARRGILQIGESQRDDGLVAGIYPTDWDNRWLPDYALIWVSSALDYYQYTGDASLLPELLPRFKKMFEGFFAAHENTNHLLTDVPHWVFIDWAPVEKHGSVTALNVFYYQALRDAAALFRAGGDPEAAKKYDSKAELVKKAINEYLWIPEKGVYADCFFGGTRCKTVSRQANSLAVLFDIAPPGKQAEIMKYMMDPASDIVREGSPYFSHYVLEALRHAGADDEAMKYVNRWKVMLDWGATSWWEVWGTGSSHCHGWSAAPTFDLSKYVLGVSPAAPGFSKVAIEPPRTGGEDLKFASGVVPTPHGDIEVRWERKDTPASFELNVKLPDGVKAEVWLPVGNIISPVLTVNGSEKLPAGARVLSDRNCCLGAEISKGGEYKFVLKGKK